MATGIALLEAEAIGELVERFGGSADGDARPCRVARLVAPQDARSSDDLVVLTSLRHVTRARGAAGVVLCTAEAGSRLPSGRRWVHDHPMWVVAALLESVAPALDREPRLDRRAALVEAGADIGAGSYVAPGAVVLPGARVGEDCHIGPNAVVYGRVVIDNRVTVGAGAVIGRPGFGWTRSPTGRLCRIPQLGGVLIGDDVEIGALCTVDAGTLGPTRIGEGSRLDAHVHVGHNVQIGRGCLIAAQTGLAGSAVIDDGVMVGGQVGVTDHAHVGAGARIAAKSGVIGDIAPGSTVAGFPAIPRWRWLRAMARR